MPLRLPFALVAIAIGVTGLGFNMSVIARVTGSPQNRPFVSFLVPLMLVPGVAYVLYVELRGPLAGEYPYTILDPGFGVPGQPPGGYVAVTIGVGVLVLSVAIFDLLLVFIDGLIARRRQIA